VAREDEPRMRSSSTDFFLNLAVSLSRFERDSKNCRDDSCVSRRRLNGLAFGGFGLVLRVRGLGFGRVWFGIEGLGFRVRGFDRFGV